MAKIIIAKYCYEGYKLKETKSSYEDKNINIQEWITKTNNLFKLSNKINGNIKKIEKRYISKGLDSGNIIEWHAYFYDKSSVSYYIEAEEDLEKYYKEIY